ncbi:anti-sigma factor [Nocardia yamanashiensis]|uniref:anti-sigma factor n=1 Tax=Nocardia yamanashiensis TaxID=209247 RepID=UPI001E36343B|nr:anti-sigma factor [Nocardia yamanashiensis]UGT44954.1 anti-sigma factor [Nocardia yamanashiensis]
MSELPADSDLLEHAYPYALDALTASDRAHLESLLDRAEPAQADSFRRTVRDIRDTLADLTVLDAHDAPPDLESRIQHALDRQLGTTAPAPVTPLRRIPPRALGLAAAALVAILALAGVAVINAARQPDSTTITAQQVLTHGDARSAATPVTGGGTASLVFSPELDAAVVTFDAVPTAPQGQTYQLWLIPEGGQPRSAGVLPALPTARTPLLVPLDSARTLALSVEPDGGSAQPTTTPIAAVTLA